MRTMTITWLRTAVAATCLASVAPLAPPAIAAEAPAASLPPRADTSALPSQRKTVMKIRITVNGTALTATLDDNAAATDFASQLPLTTALEDYASTEKITYLPRKLTTVGAPAGMQPSAGDIAYYAPWGNLAIFYRDARYADGLVKLGHIDDGIEALKVRGALKATIERAEK